MPALWRRHATRSLRICIRLLQTALAHVTIVQEPLVANQFQQSPRDTATLQKTTRFRQLIEAEEILVQPGVYDGFSARLVQQMGFAAGSISGAGLSESNLGWADVGLMG